MFSWFKRRPRAGEWSKGEAPENVVLIVGKLGQQFTGGDGRPIQYPPEVAFAWCRQGAPWINFSTGHPLTWAPDMWMVLPDLAGIDAPAVSGGAPRAKRGSFGI